ncbi:hypothetical protein FJO98_14020 [Enterococcus sp. PF-2]|uniref:DUF7006 family protein n=1 Tax=unclassified Enterococcus TaxID=2608891 RepID=UPI0010EF464E|nr:MULTISPECIES: hypothetical protein [unclassified Enterococcus]TPE00623.1 hypothetical protein FJP08_14625 [Enterococcus sp. PF-3]TPE24192.1 hypothetical protein FJO98_14020 [Enterococcus sp. PF-2]VTT38247.1 Uncharacterised protein [Enterococcus casseliflavus]
MSINSVKEYFHFFDESIEKQTSIKIQEYYEGIKKEFTCLIQSISSANALPSIKELMILDAKLQILSSLMEDNIFKLSEQEIIRLSEIDSASYYEEIFKLDGMTHTNDYHSLLFL